MTGHGPIVRQSPAGERLTRALVDLADAGRFPPCSGGDEWLSDDPADRARAAEWCQPCPIIAACGAAADEAREKFGTWAGRDRTKRSVSR